MRHQHPRLKQVVSGLIFATLLGASAHAAVVAKANANGPVWPVIAAVSQNPGEAENYRKLAAAKRKAAQNVPAKRDCYLAWARYYDCLAARSETGDGRNCGAQPADC